MKRGRNGHFVRYFHEFSWKKGRNRSFRPFRTIFSWIFMKRRPKPFVSAVSYDIFVKIHEKRPERPFRTIFSWKFMKKKAEITRFGRFVRYKIKINIYIYILKIYGPGPGRAGFSYYKPGLGRAGIWCKILRPGRAGLAFWQHLQTRAGPGFRIWPNAGL